MASASRARRRRTLRRIARCPDCNSTVQVISSDPRRPLASVGHDETCPWFNARNGGQAFRAVRLVDLEDRP